MWFFCGMDWVYILLWTDIFAGVEHFCDSSFSAKPTLGKNRPLLSFRVVGAIWVVLDTFHFLLKELRVESASAWAGCCQNH